jgi:hypothetical protein
MRGIERRRRRAATRSEGQFVESLADGNDPSLLSAVRDRYLEKAENRKPVAVPQFRQTPCMLQDLAWKVF